MINQSSIIMLLTSIFFVFTLNTVNAQPRLLEKTHGGYIDSCKEIEYCKQADLDKCLADFRGAFKVCDPIFMKNPKDPNMNDYAACIADNAKDASMAMFMPSPGSCQKEERIPYFYVSEASSPPDKPLEIEVFTDNSFDWDNIILYPDVKSACQAGAQRIKTISEQTSPVEVSITITSMDKITEIYGENGGAGETAYSHIFSTPAYPVGDCIGKSKTVVLKNDGIFKKGEVINNEYSDRIFVVVQCNKEPMHKLCVK